MRFQTPLRLVGRWLPAISALLLSALLTGCASQGEGSETTRDEELAPPVEAVQARFGSLPLSVRLNGVVKARNQVAVRPEIAARVVAVLVESGETVRLGQPLVRLDDAALAKRLRQAEAGLRLAEAAARAERARLAELEAQVVRSRSLAGQELISDLELETQEARLTAAEAEADQAVARAEEARATVAERRTELERAVVRSPVAGRVGQRRVEVGMLADPGSLLFQVGNLDQVQIEVPLTERMLNLLEPGQTALVAIQGSDAEPRRAPLARISPFLEDGSFSTIGEIDLANPDGALRSGMFVEVEILYGESERATLVPTSVLWDDPRSGRYGIFVLSDPAFAPGDELSEEAVPVELRTIEILAEGRTTIGLRGIEPEEWVVSVGQHLLTEEDGRARVRAIAWDQVLELQSLQKEDLLRGFLDKQRRLARSQGATLTPLSTAGD
ncbi:MAG: efflux RND transporter periplasmic adaptor subunit [Acidobacteriota bacterium]